MNGYLVDTSVWIDYFNEKKDSPWKQKIDVLLESNNEIFMCPIIYQEILQGFRDDGLFNRTKKYISDFDMVKTDIMTVSKYAIDIYRTLRKRGLTVRKPQDCLIAAYAMIEDLSLLHNDKDFDTISTVFELKTELE